MTAFDPANASPTPSEALLTPANCVFLFIDHQPQMFFGTTSGDRQTIISNTVALGKAAKVFNVPVVLTTVASETFSGHLLPPLAAEFPDHPILDRTSMNAWEDAAVVEAIKATGRRKIVLSGLWTEVCLVMPSLSALDQGYEIYLVADASGGVTMAAHDHALQRISQHGGHVVTWLQTMLELQRDWARQATYEPVNAIVKERAGAYGLGIYYARDFIGAHAVG